MSRKPRERGKIHVATNRRQGKNREYVTHLLRHSYREGGRAKNKTVGNISHLPEEIVELVRRALKGEEFLSVDDSFEIERSLPAGHVSAALACAAELGLAELIDRSKSRNRSLVMAMVISRILCPGSKLGLSRSLSQSTLGEELEIQGASEDDFYRALDWLYERQERVEKRLARRHIQDGSLVLYDLSSSYFEGRSCELAKRGYSRDKRRGSLQIVYGLLCDREGRPVAIEVFEGNLQDAQTVPAQVQKLKERFGVGEIILVSDRGMVTRANLDLIKETEGIEWITALKAPQVKRLARRGDLQPSLFDKQNLAEITSEEFPAERLVVCRNPLVAEERTRKRDELLEETEVELEAIRERVVKGTLSAHSDIALAVGGVANHYKMKKHFDLAIAEGHFTYSRKVAQIAEEAALDGIYVIRSSADKRSLDTRGLVETYKGLSNVEDAFKAFKGPLEIRPIHHRLTERVKAHVFCCMLSYYLEWHLRQALDELTFKDEDRPERVDPVAKATRSKQALDKAASKTNARGEVVYSFQSLMSELALLTRNTILIPGTGASFERDATPSAIQARALELAKQV